VTSAAGPPEDEPDERPDIEIPAVAVPAVDIPVDIPVDKIPPGVFGPPGLLLRLVKDQRVAFLAVGVTNTAVGFFWFIVFQATVGQRFGYLATLVCAHVASVLCAFVLYRYIVFRVRGHVLRDLLRFETVYLTALGVNFVLLPVLVELVHLPVLLSQAIIVLLTSTMSWLGHKNFSFHRGGPSPQPPPGSARPDPSEPSAQQR